MTIANLWLVDVRPDGSVAFRERKGIRIAKQAESLMVARLPLFSPSDYSVARREDLRRAIKQVLIAEGLFEDEAEAMLETWKESYFQASGLRILHVVPKEWTNYFLPLEISVPATMTSVMIGRIDLMGGR